MGGGVWEGEGPCADIISADQNVAHFTPQSIFVCALKVVKPRSEYLLIQVIDDGKSKGNRNRFHCCHIHGGFLRM